jgi:hypothetical protein
MEREGGLPCRLLPYLQARTSPSCNVIGMGVRIVSVLACVYVACDHYFRVQDGNTFLYFCLSNKRIKFPCVERHQYLCKPTFTTFTLTI